MMVMIIIMIITYNLVAYRVNVQGGNMKRARMSGSPNQDVLNGWNKQRKQLRRRKKRS